MTANGDSTHTHACSMCGEIKPLTTEFFHWDKRRASWKKHCVLCQRAMCRKHYEENKESYHARARAFEKAHPEWQRARNKKYLSENRQKVNDRLRNRRLTDPVYCIERRIRTLIADTIRRSGFTKRHGAAAILGCDWAFFKSHIEKQFPKGMTWDNRSEWHIDHIRPIAIANTEEEVIALNHFTNLRPLWAKDNHTKSAKITHLI